MTEKYSVEKAQEEAEKLRKKVESGEVSSYSEAEHQLRAENRPLGESLAEEAKNMESGLDWPRPVEFIKRADEQLIPLAREFDDKRKALIAKGLEKSSTLLSDIVQDFTVENYIPTPDRRSEDQFNAWYIPYLLRLVSGLYLKDYAKKFLDALGLDLHDFGTEKEIFKGIKSWDFDRDKTRVVINKFKEENKDILDELDRTPVDEVRGEMMQKIYASMPGLKAVSADERKWLIVTYQNELKKYKADPEKYLGGVLSHVTKNFTFTHITTIGDLWKRETGSDELAGLRSQLFEAMKEVSTYNKPKTTNP